MRLPFLAILLFSISTLAIGQSYPVSTTEAESYISLTPAEFEAITKRVIELRRYQLWLQQQRQLQFRQPIDRPQANAGPATGTTNSTATATSDTDQRLATIERMLRELQNPTAQAPAGNTWVQDPATARMEGNTTAEDPRIALLNQEIEQLRRQMDTDRERYARGYDNQRELERYETENRTLRAQSDYELDRLRRQGKLTEREYRYQRNLLREQNRRDELALERQRLAEQPVVTTPATTTPRPAIIPVPFTSPGRRDTVFIERNVNSVSTDPALRAELAAMRASLAALEGRSAPTAPPVTVIERPSTGTPAPVMAVTRSFPAILFANGSANIPANYQSVVDAVADAYRRGRIDEVTVTGYASPTGSAALNQDLSRRRAEAVRAALVAAGLPAGMIQTIYGGINYEFKADAAARRVELQAIGTGR